MSSTPFRVKSFEVTVTINGRAVSTYPVDNKALCDLVQLAYANGGNLSETLLICALVGYIQCGSNIYEVAQRFGMHGESLCESLF